MTNRYVAKAEGGGDNAHPGTITEPWLTVAYSVTQLNAGDTLYIRAGTYKEHIEISHDGTEVNPIRITSYSGETVVFDNDMDSGLGVCFYVSGDYVQLSDFEVCNVYGWGVYLIGNYDLADNLYTHHCWSSGIDISYGIGSIAQNCSIWRCALSNEYGTMETGWGTGISIARNNVSYATIRHCTAWENWGEGISCYEASHIIMEDNISYNNWAYNFYISDMSYVLFQRNFSWMKAATDYTAPYGGTHIGIVLGDEVGAASSDITIINNISMGGRRNFYGGAGYRGAGMRNILVANNTLVNSIAYACFQINETNPHVNYRFQNNIVIQEDALPVALVETDTAVNFSNNCWSKTPQTAASGYGDIMGNAKLVRTGLDTDPNWYKLQSDSPCIDAGMTIAEVTDDYLGNPRG